MRVYQFMSEEHALSNLQNRWLKVSLLEDLNDPFELLGALAENANQRVAMRRWRAHMSERVRLLCFSTRYTNPVMWSHYADKHRGMCLAFDVPDEILVPVIYDAGRFVIDFAAETRQHGGVSEATVGRLLRTKYLDWEYESEVRMWVRPAEVCERGGLQFYSFNDQLRLRAVYKGPRSILSKREIERNLCAEEQRTEVYATRLAFRSYRIMRTPWASAPHR